MHPLNKYVQERVQEVEDLRDLEGFIQQHRSAFVEPKIDGMRVYLFFHSQGRSVMATKRQQVFTAADCPFLNNQVSMPENTILDCEFVKKTGSIFAFDVVAVKNEDVRSLPLRERKRILDAMPLEYVQKVPWLELTSAEQVLAAYEKAVKAGYEGIVVKAPEVPYGTPHAWLKKKRFETFPAFVIAFKETERTRKAGEIWAYEVGVYDEHMHVQHVCDVSSAVKGVDTSRIRVGTVLELRYQPTPGF